MKILRIIARLNVGGPARHVVWLSEGLKSDGYETLLVTGVVPPGEDDMSYLAAAAGVQPLVLREMSREISLQDALTVWKLYRLMVREHPDLVHTHTAKAGTVGRVAGVMYRWLTPATLIGRPRPCRFVHTYHGHVFHSYYGSAKTRLFLTIEKALARFATDRLVVVSEQQREEINGRFGVGRGEQFAVIPLGIDLSIFADWEERRRAFRKSLDAGPDELLVGIVGRLTEIKNHRLFLEAAAALKKLAAMKMRFVVVGDGSLRRELERQAEGLGLTNEVVFLGTRNDPENFYPALDVVALTSWNEGTPLSLIEAMANARPVISTAVGGVVDIVGRATTTSDEAGFQICERGLTVKTGDAEGLAHGLARLLKDAALRRELAERGKEFVLTNYAKERLIADISGLYRQLLRRDASSETNAIDPATGGEYRARLTPRS